MDKYSAREAQLLTKTGPKNIAGVAGSARQQGNMAKKPFAAFDIDGTLIRWQLYHAIADQLVKLGYIAPTEFSKIKQARMAWKNRDHPESFKDYEQALVGLYNELLKELTYKQFIEAAEAVFDEYKEQTYSYTRDLIKSLKAEGYLLFAISGSQSEIVEMIAKYYDFDDYSGTDFIHINNRFTGEVIHQVGKKHRVLEDMVKKHNAQLPGSIAVGDSAGDISMLEFVEKPIVLNPEKKLFDIAKQKGWKIVLERKNVVYELENDNGKYKLA